MFQRGHPCVMMPVCKSVYTVLDPFSVVKKRNGKELYSTLIASKKEFEASVEVILTLAAIAAT